MLGILEILLAILCISAIIYVIKNYNHIRQKINENQLYEGIAFGIYLIIVIVILSFSILYIIESLDKFEIIDAQQYLTNNKVSDNGVENSYEK